VAHPINHAVLSGSSKPIWFSNFEPTQLTGATSMIKNHKETSLNE
jgi:hypothetical protein